MVTKSVDPQGPSQDDFAIANQFVQRIGEVLDTAFKKAAGIDDLAQRQQLIGEAFMEAMSNYEAGRRFLTYEDRSLRPQQLKN